MKTYITTFILAAFAICRADGAYLRAGGYFLYGDWSAAATAEASYISGITDTGFFSDVTLTATPQQGYKPVGWYYRLSPLNSRGENLSEWTRFSSEVGSQDTCIAGYPSPFSGNNAYYIALNLNYVSYGISFNYAGGTGETSSMPGLVITNSVTLPIPNNRVGYTFVAWTNNVGRSFQAGVPLTPAVDLGIGNVDTNFTLTAQWQAQTMSIEYDLAEGVYGDGAVHPYSATYDQPFMVSPPTRTGYVFNGWEFENINTETARYGTTSNPDTSMSTGSAYPYGGGDIWLKNLSTNSSPAVTMTATWKPKTYTVTLSVSGANNNPTTELKATYGEKLPKVTTTPRYDNADFMGFYTQPEGQGEKYWNSDGTPYVATWTNSVDMTFYEYKGNLRRKLIFHGNGGIPAQTLKDAAVGSTYGSVMPTVSWDGGKYVFAGWFTAAEGGVEVLAEALVEDGSGDIDLYAHWEVATYFVRFDGNGATNETEMALQEIPFDFATPLSANEYGKVGFSFAGWSVDGSATVTYADCAVVSNLSSTAGETNVLTAVWTTNTYYVAFDANGGAGTMATLTNLYGVAYEYPECTFTRNGFWAFSCWSNTVNGITNAPGMKFSSLTDKNGETVLIKAVWSTTLTKLSLAMHCDNLQWSNQVSTAVGTDWVDEWGPNLGYNQSGSMVSQTNRSIKSIQASVKTNGTFRFQCRTYSGAKGLLRVWTSYDPAVPYDSGIYTREISIEALPEGSWQEVEFSVSYNGNPQSDSLYVNLANRTANNKICIDQMKWIPEGSDVPVEPGPGDEREFSSLVCSGDSLFLSFPDADDRFSYVLRGTNDLVAPMPWPALFSTNGTGSITIETKILPGVPCMFYYLETMSK